MIRLILVVGFLFFFFVLSYPYLMFQSHLAKKDIERRDRESFETVKKVLNVVRILSGVKMEVKGLENIPNDTAVLYVGNHRSYYDIVTAYTTVPKPMGFVAKIELDSFPILRTWMKNVNCLFLDRDDIKQGLRTIMAGAEQVKRGVSVWIFPEGTRDESEDLRELLPFKEGSLKIAQRANCPVVPVAMTGTRDAFENHFPWVRPAKVTIEFGTPFYLNDLDPDDKKHPGAYTARVITKMLDELMNEENGGTEGRTQDGTR